MKNAIDIRKEREDQWADEKFWLNHSLTSKEQEVIKLQNDFKELERDNQESQQVNQSQQEKIEALEKLNKELGDNQN